jgi:hypothetical protein
VLRACRDRHAAALATASSRCELQRVKKTADRESKKRPAPEATTEDKKAAAATQLLASNEAVTDADLDALLPDQGYETLAKPAAPKKNAAVTDADLDAILPDEGYEKKDAQPEG